MAAISITLEDAGAAQADFGRLLAAVQDAGRLRLLGGFTAPYARRVEARRGMLAAGTEATRAQISALILSDLTARRKVQTDAIRRVWATEVQRRTPVRTGRLRDSFTVLTGRG